MGLVAKKWSTAASRYWIWSTSTEPSPQQSDFSPLISRSISIIRNSSGGWCYIIWNRAAQKHDNESVTNGLSITCRFGVVCGCELALLSSNQWSACVVMVGRFGILRRWFSVSNWSANRRGLSTGWVSPEYAANAPAKVTRCWWLMMVVFRKGSQVRRVERVVLPVFYTNWVWPRKLSGLTLVSLLTVMGQVRSLDRYWTDIFERVRQTVQILVKRHTNLVTDETRLIEFTFKWPAYKNETK